MRIVKSKVECYTESDPLLKIEKIARVCWKTEDQIKKDSAEKLIRGCISKGHMNILGGYHITVKLNPHVDPTNVLLLVYLNTYLRTTVADDKPITISGNIQAWRDWLPLACQTMTINNRRGLNETIQNIIKSLREFSPIFFEDISLCEQRMELHDKSIVVDVSESKDYMTLKWTTDRGISHEGVRHRVASFMQSSTRYVNYNKKGIEFINPEVFDWSTDRVMNISEAQLQVVTSANIDLEGLDNEVKKCNIWRESMLFAEKQYNRMINAGCSPQEARSVLPNSLQTELFITATHSEWDGIVKLRDHSAAHPQIRALMPETKRYLMISKEKAIS